MYEKSRSKGRDFFALSHIYWFFTNLIDIKKPYFRKVLIMNSRMTRYGFYIITVKQFSTKVEKGKKVLRAESSTGKL